MNKPVVLIVLDGWGYREDAANNAIAAAKKPFWDSLWQNYPHSLLLASGEAVGLPEGVMGNSEVGHMTIGTGKPAVTDLVRIDRAIADGSFAKNPTFGALFAHVKKFHSTLHVQGLLSPGGVHSHQDHLFAFLRLAKANDVPRVAVHVFTDGRDTAPQSASKYIQELESVLAELGPNFFIATLSGRYYAMDRDNNWDRLARVEHALFDCKGNICTIKPSAYLETQYKKGKNDELLEPTVCATPEGTGCAIKKNDAVFFFNFRSDRARMLSEKMLTRPREENILFATMTEYCVDWKCEIAFPVQKSETTLGLEISRAGFAQVHIAETEKFAHATYFLNGGNEAPYDGERDILIKSRMDIKTHDQSPEMRAHEIADAVIIEIEDHKNGEMGKDSKPPADFIFANFANADMVGHTANVPAIVAAIEILDAELKRVVEALNKKGGVALITADHGNAEINLDPTTGIRHTAHTTSPVPCILTSQALGRLRDGALCDIAPTILTLLGLKVPAAMDGTSLLA